MARTTKRFTRVYADGYDLSGHTVSIGPLSWVYEDTPIACMSDAVKGTLPGLPTITTGALNGVLDNTATTGLHVIASAGDTSRIVTTAVGMNAEPAAGNPVFCGKWQQTGYHAVTDGNIVTVNIPFGDSDQAAGLNYDEPWGKLIHAKGAETGTNSAAGVDFLAGTAKGGWMVAQIFAVAGTGNVTIKLQSATTSGGVYSDITGLTTGAIAHTSVPCAVIAQAATTETINQFVRWQIALSGITSVTFALAFMPGR